MTRNKENNNIRERPPIVVVLGHVDHGKSTLLDYIRKTNTTEKEAGGITQHMSAYEVIHKTNDGKEKHITFLDTPGHKAFIQMRERGVNLADIAILVVSGEDGVKEQTIEVLKIIRESKMPYVVAINKVDKANVDIQKIKQGLAEHEVLVEGYGGDIPVVPISAKTGVGIPELLDIILLLAELEDLKGNADKEAEGIVVESHVSPQKGTVATIIIKDGTLHKGEYVAIGNAVAPIRKIETFLNQNAEEATFSSPVVLSGFSDIPTVGAHLHAFKTKKDAESYLEKNTQNSAHASNMPRGNKETADLEKETFFVPIVIKADSSGSLEALEHEIMKLQSGGSALKIVHRGIGSIEESDLKAAANGKDSIVLGFHIEVSKTAEKIAAQQNITVKTFDIIYKLTEWLLEEIKQRTPKVLTEERTGSAKIMKLFGKTKNQHIVGGKVTEGEISTRQKIKIIRRQVEIDRGTILELRQQKTKVGNVEAGSEFGALIESKYDIAPGDVIEAFALVEK
ncbi:MAG: translation initiation factor IF-2 [bacterium]|nr:translation initiation factor IF-2 [bacterium]